MSKGIYYTATGTTALAGILHLFVRFMYELIVEGYNHLRLRRRHYPRITND